MNTANYEDPHYAALSNVLSLDVSLCPNYSLSTSCWVHVPPIMWKTCGFIYFNPCPMTPWREKRYNSTLPLTSALDGGGWSMPRSSHFTPGKSPVPIVQEVRWAPGLVWTGAENLTPTRIWSLDCPACSKSLYRLHYHAIYITEKVQGSYRKSWATIFCKVTRFIIDKPNTPP